MQVTAAVVRERSGPFVIDTLELTDPRPDEVLVRVVASGYHPAYPRVGEIRTN
jgi:aryl-alcohol dehydrogenase